MKLKLYWQYENSVDKLVMLIKLLSNIIINGKITLFLYKIAKIFTLNNKIWKEINIIFQFLYLKKNQ